jgi:acetyl/propionyl-CoA carboxylase alpha subunit
MNSAVYDITVGGTLRRVRVTRMPVDSDPTGPLYEVQVDGGPVVHINAVRPVQDVLSLIIDDQCWEAGLVARDDGFEVELLGVRHEVEVLDPKRKALRMTAGAGGVSLISRMPGRVMKLLVAVGDVIKKGQPMIVVEAMKMENELKSPADGTVSAIKVAVGDLIETRALLIELA